MGETRIKDPAGILGYGFGGIAGQGIMGYLDYSNRYADLLFQVISGRYKKRSTIVTTNKAFQEWNTIFPNAICVSTLVDRLMHKAELVVIKGKSYREHEAIERAQAKAKERKSRRTNPEGAIAKC